MRALETSLFRFVCQRGPIRITTRSRDMIRTDRIFSSCTARPVSCVLIQCKKLYHRLI